MRYLLQRSFIVGLLVVAGCAGSGSTDNATATAKPELEPRSTATQAPPQPGKAGAPPAPASDAGAAAIKAGARYAILCSRVGGEGHERQARLTKENLVRSTGRSEFHVVHSADYSEVMYGYYTERSPLVNAAEAQRAEKDLKWLKGLKGPNGSAMFARSLIIPLPVPDPVANPAWDLALLDKGKPALEPGRSYWSIVVAAYTADALDPETRLPIDRKQAAVESVKAAREQGIPAYYWHGENVSHVCIGVWPRSAIREQEKSSAESRSESSADSGEALVVSPGGLSQGMTEQMQANPNVKVFQPKIDVLDPTLMATWKKYSDYVLNGAVPVDRITDPLTGKVTSKTQNSFLVEIPRMQAAEGGAAAAGAAVREQQVAPSTPMLIDPARGSSPGGSLRRVDR
ncbi:MAG TPA: hypothetical protein VGB55_06680 [Tepidisphaeraceae bacterium]|jgi:hypothetical protein